MTVAYGAISASASFTNDTTFSSPNVVTRGALVFIVGATAASAPDEIVGVTWGGVAMTRVTTVADLTTEFIRSYAYFLGSGIPSGIQSVVVDCSGVVTTKQAYAIGLTAAGNTAVEGFATHSADIDDPSVTITTGATVNTWVGAVIGSGLGVPTNITAGAGYTLIANRDFGNQILQVERINANDAGGNVVANFITSASDDVAMIAVAIKEVAGAAIVVAPAANAPAASPVSVIKVAVTGVGAATAARGVPVIAAERIIPAAAALASRSIPVVKIAVGAAFALADANDVLRTSPTLRTEPTLRTDRVEPRPETLLAVGPAAGSATASRVIPALTQRVTVPIASATAAAPSGLPVGRVSPAAASLSASAPTPVVRVTFPASAGSAIGPPMVLLSPTGRPQEGSASVLIRGL